MKRILKLWRFRKGKLEVKRRQKANVARVGDRGEDGSYERGLSGIKRSLRWAQCVVKMSDTEDVMLLGITRIYYLQFALSSLLRTLINCSQANLEYGKSTTDQCKIWIGQSQCWITSKVPWLQQTRGCIEMYNAGLDVSPSQCQKSKNILSFIIMI